MAELFYGPWLVRVMDTNSPFDQRFVISGSDGSDGQYAEVPGYSVIVTGDEWALEMEWLDGKDFRRSGMMRSAVYDVYQGLIVSLIANAEPPQKSVDPARFSSRALLHLQSLDEALDPLKPSGNPFDFTIPDAVITEDVPPRQDH